LFVYATVLGIGWERALTGVPAMLRFDYTFALIVLRFFLTPRAFTLFFVAMNISVVSL
jgi:hypothetical protein